MLSSKVTRALTKNKPFLIPFNANQKKFFCDTKINSKLISAIDRHGKYLSISYKEEDGLRERDFLYYWLRDHCRCSQCFHPQTRQRMHHPSTIPLNIQPKKIEVSNDRMVVEWENGKTNSHKSEYDLSWLRQLQFNSGITESKEKLYYTNLWDSSIEEKRQILETPFEKVMKDDESLLSWLRTLNKYGFAFITDVPPSYDGTEQVLKRIGTIRTTFYGHVWDFGPNMEYADTAYTSESIALHTDGNYFSEPIGYQVFHCIERKCTGGVTTLVDGFKAVELLYQENPEYYDLLSTTPLLFHYEDNVRNLKNRTPVIVKGNRDDAKASMIRFNDSDRNVLDLPLANQEKFYEAYNCFYRIINTLSNQYRFTLTPGSLMMFDNWRVLHARDSFTGHRRVVGCYYNKEDIESTYRALTKEGRKDKIYLHW